LISAPDWLSLSSFTLSGHSPPSPTTYTLTLAIQDPYGLGTTTSFLLIVGETSVNYSPSFDSNIGLIELKLEEVFELQLPLC